MTSGERSVKARRALEPESNGHVQRAPKSLGVSALGANALAGDEKRGGTDSQRGPRIARAEIVDKPTRRRFEIELEGALKRKNGGEAKLAGALRAVAALSPALRASMADAATVMLRRKSFSRELYVGCIRALAEAEDRSTTTLLKQALGGDEAGGTAALSAACFSRDAALTGVLAKLAASRQSHLAFGAETARVARSESNGAHLAALAPMIKESHRISLCVELFVPLARSGTVPLKVGPALTVLRGAERHLGRWLVLGEVAAASGDATPIEEAKQRSTVGPTSARSAWSLVSWALMQRAAQAQGAAPVGLPQTRPTVELVARLSDRPSADRDTTFLFRMARAGAPSAKPMLEALAKAVPLADEVAIRASLYLARDHGRDDLRDALIEAAREGKREDLRGVAAAALWDLGMRSVALEHADALVESKILGNVAWGALVRSTAARSRGVEPAEAPAPTSQTHASREDDVLTETPFRWIQWGWLE